MVSWSRLGAAFVAAGAVSVAVPVAAEIEEIVVTARGVEESVRDIPVAVNVVGEGRIENYNLDSLEDVAEVTPTLNIRRASSGSGASISIRGIGSSSSTISIEQSVSTVIDGVYYPQGRVINESMFDVKQVAVLKGPQALFFGKNATAGVLAVDTNGPGEEFEGLFRAGYEFEQERQVYEGILSGPVTDTLGARLALRYSDMSGGFIKNNVGTTTYTTTDAATFAQTDWTNPPPDKDKWPGRESFYGRLTLQWDPTERAGFTMKASYADSDYVSPTGGLELWSCPTLNGEPHAVAGGVPVPNTLAECNPDWNSLENRIPPGIAETNPRLNKFDGELGEDYESYSITLKGDYSFENFDVTAIFNYHDQETNWVGDFDGGGATAVFASEHNTFDNTSLEIRGVSNFDSPLNFVLGAFWQTNERHFEQDVIFAGAQNTASPLPSQEFTAYDKLSETDLDTLSVYGELIWDVSEVVQVTGGLRWIEEEKDSFFHQPYVNPFFTGLFVLYDPNDPLTEVVADQKFDKVVPEVTVRWEATDNVTLYVAYKEGFKGGGMSNSGILSNAVISAGGDAAADFIFDEETVEGWEAGVKASLLDGAMTVEFEVYDYDFEDLQIDFFNSPTFAFITTNAGASTTTGGELNVTWAPPGVDGLILSGAIIYNEGEYDDFIAPCYAGQTPALGCDVPILPGEAPKQQLGGSRRGLAPKWAGYLAADYDIAVADNLLLGFSANVQFKGKHQLSEFGFPFAFQDSYETLDASIRLGSQDERWQVAIIGKNLTDEYALVFSGDNPSTGGGTGTPGGFLADQRGTPIFPRTIAAELTLRF